MRTQSKLSLALGAVAAFGLALAQPAKASFVNPSFEDSPDFVGYTTTGNASIQGVDFKAPVQGNQQAVISNSLSTAPDDVPAVTNIPSLDAFFNLTAGTLAGMDVKSGSGFKQTFTANAGDSIKFWFDFATNEDATVVGHQNDFGFFTLQGPGAGPASLTVLATPVAATSTTNVMEGVSSYFNQESGYTQETGFQSVTLNLATTGTYTLSFGVANVHDTFNASGLLIDALSGVSPSNVPLPSTAWAGIMLLGGLGLSRLMRRRTVAIV